MTGPAPLRTDHRHLLSLTWPVLLANVTVPLVGTVDTAIMGRFPEPAFIGAVALGALLYTSVSWLFGFLRMGTTGQVAQAHGRGEGSFAAAVTGRALRWAAVIGIALLALSPWLLPPLLDAFGASEQVAALAYDYLAIRRWALPALLTFLVAQGALFGLQAMQSALLASLTLNLTSTALSLTLAVGFHLGLQGIALGSLIADWLSALVAVTLVHRALKARGATRGLVSPPSLLKASSSMVQYLRMNGDLLLRSIFVQAPFLLYTAVGARFGDLVLAANAILMQLFFLLVHALDAFAHTAESLAGASYGARDGERFRQVLWRTSLWSAALAGLGGLLLLLSADTLFGWLTEVAAVRQEADRYRLWLAAAPLISVMAFQLDGIFIGTMQTRAMRDAMLIACVAFVLVLWLLLPVLGNHALWLGLFVFMLLRALLLGSQLPRLLRHLDR